MILIHYLQTLKLRKRKHISQYLLRMESHLMVLVILLNMKEVWEWTSLFEVNNLSDFTLQNTQFDLASGGLKSFMVVFSIVLE